MSNPEESDKISLVIVGIDDRIEILKKAKQTELVEMYLEDLIFFKSFLMGLDKEDPEIRPMGVV